MQVIPAINETDFGKVSEKIGLAAEFSKWVHIDVADGKFTKNILWNNPQELKDLRAASCEPRVNIEVHLMVRNPEEVLKDWLKAGIQRVVVHLETAKNMDYIKEQCGMAGVELVLALDTDASAEEYSAHRGVKSFLILAVEPGFAGQKFQDNQLAKIMTLRQKMPDVRIEVDGGVNLETAPKIKEAGADVLISASYIWDNKDPKAAYEKLKAIM